MFEPFEGPLILQLLMSAGGLAALAFGRRYFSSVFLEASEVLTGAATVESIALEYVYAST